MQAPRLSSDNTIVVNQRRASRDITFGIEAEIAELHVLSALRRMREVSLFCGLYALGALMAAVSDERLVVTALGVVCMGVALNSLGILIHDGLHGLLAKNAHANHLLSFLCGLPLGISATAYQVTHNNHHYELGRKLDYGTYRQHLRRPSLIWFAYFLQLSLGTVLYVVFIPFLGFAAASNRSRCFITLEYLAIALTFWAVCVSAPTENVVLFWAYPLFVMSLLTNVRGLGSHALGDVENIYLSSRTITCSRLVSVLFLHENYHLEHHLFPRVPSYHLPKVHALVWQRLPEALHSCSYAQFLREFLGAAVRNDLTPLGAIKPS